MAISVYIDNNVWDFLFERKLELAKTIKDCDIETCSFFGFYDEGHPPDEQRVGGWGEGYWASKEELAFIEEQKTCLGSDKKPTTRLYKNEADIALAARSFHSVVLHWTRGGRLKTLMSRVERSSS